MSDIGPNDPPTNSNDVGQELPYAIASEEDRCAPRHRLSIPARMRFSCSSSFAVEVTNMSLAGFACDAVLDAYPGRLCWLTLPGLESLEAEVIPHNENGMGCAFKNLLHPAVLRHYAMKYPAG